MSAKIEQLSCAKLKFYTYGFYSYLQLYFKNKVSLLFLAVLLFPSVDSEAQIATVEETILVENFNSNAMPVGWLSQSTNAQGTENIWSIINSALRIDPVHKVDQNTWVYMKGLTLKAGIKYTIRYTVGAAGSMSVRFMVGKAQSESSQSLISNVNVRETANTHTFVPGETATYYFAFHCNELSAHHNNYVTIDNIEIIEEGLTFANEISVGQGGQYTTLTAAVNALKVGKITAPTVLSLTSSEYTAAKGEAFPIVIPAIEGLSSVNTLTIKPAVSTATISGSVDNGGIIKLNGVANINLNGLRVHNAAMISPRGIEVVGGTNNATLWGCNVSAGAVDGKSTGGVYGIRVAEASNIRLINNMIHSILGAGTKNTSPVDINFENPYGIMLGANSNNIKVYNNSVSITGARSNDYSASAALGISSTSSGLDIRNNILGNSRSNKGNNYAVYSAASLLAFTEINYNLYYASSPEGSSFAHLGYIGGQVTTTLNAWKSATLKDKSSMLADKMVFNGSNDLTIDNTKPECWYMNGTGVQLTEVNRDYSGVRRSITVVEGAVDLGAVEFTPGTGVVAPYLESKGLRINGGREVFYFANREICAINWSSSALSPVFPNGNSFQIRYMPGGKLNTEQEIGLKSMNSWIEIIDNTLLKDSYNFTYDFEMFFDDALLGELASTEFVMSKKPHATATWEVFEDAVVGLGNDGKRILKKGNLKTFSEITATENPRTGGSPSPLPVELAYFKGQVQAESIKLSWSTAMEKDNDRFEIERSQNGKQFSKIGQVKGKGNSANTVTYNFTDIAPAAGINYYRLRQIDTDGTETFSTIVALEMAANTRTMAASIASVYPTVTSEAVTIKLSTVNSATISVLDISGKPVTNIATTTEQEVVLPVQNLQSGVYFVKVNDGQNSQTQRFIKQ